MDYTARNSIRFIIGLWLLTMVVIVNSYSGVLTSLLAIPKLEPTIESVEDLVASEQYKLTIEKDVILTRDFLVSSYCIYEEL